MANSKDFIVKNGIQAGANSSITGTLAVGNTSITGTLSTTGNTAVTGNLTVNTVTAGAWNGSVIAGQYGGTGVNNSGKTITLGGNITTANSLTTSGNFATTLTATAATNVTLPTTGTLATLAGSETLTNKTLTSPTINAGALSGTFTGSPIFSGTINANNMIVVDTGSTNYTDGYTLRSGTIASGNPGLYIKKQAATDFRILSWNGTTNEGSLTLTFPAGITASANLSVGSNLVVTGNTNIDSGTLYVDASNNLTLIGSTIGYPSRYSGSTITGDTANADFQVHGTGSYALRGSFIHWASGTLGARIQLGKSKGAKGTHTVVATGDTLGEMQFAGSDGTDFVIGSAIRSEVESDPTANNVPSNITFRTANSGSGSAIFERMRIAANGNVGIGTSTPSSTLHVAGTSNISGNTSIGGNLTITGNLTINGTTTTVNSTTVTLDDPILTLGGDTAPTLDDNKDRGIEFRWHNGTVAKSGFFGFDDSTGYFTFIPDATNTSEVFSGTTGILDATALLANNSSYLGGTIASGYQTTAGLSANVATLTANNSTYLNGQLASYYTNATNISTGTLAVARGGTGVTTSTGSGSVVLSAGPTFTGNTTFDTDTLFVDATNNRVGVGTITPSSPFHLAATGLGDLIDTLRISHTNAGATFGPALLIQRDSSTPANNDAMGYITFRGNNSAGNASDYAWIQSYIIDTTATTEDGALALAVKKNGNYTEVCVASNSGIDVTGNVVSSSQITGSYTTLANGTTAMALATNHVVKVTPTATATFTTTVAAAGSRASIIILTSGASSYTITFGTGFKTTGTLATGTTTAKTFVVDFVSDGTSMIEVSRTTAM